MTLHWSAELITYREPTKWVDFVWSTLMDWRRLKWTVKVGKDIRTLEAAVEAVKEGKVHIAQEVTVGAIAHLSKTNYGAKPIFMGPTCKKGTWIDCLRQMLTVAEMWKRSPDGAAKHGPLFAVAADGASKNRAAMFVLCMHDEILPGNPLYPFIYNFRV
jgi:hypothetical protein